MVIENISLALRTVLNERFDILFIPDYDNGNEPVDDYATVGVTIVNQVHQSDSNYIVRTDTITERLKQDFRVLVTLTFYGNSAYNMAFQTQAALKMSEIKQKLFYENCLSIMDVTNIRRVPELRETKYIQRATFDATILTSYEQLSDIDWFNIVGYSADYKDTDIQYTTYVPQEP
jgi:hypothetical protein